MTSRFARCATKAPDLRIVAEALLGVGSPTPSGSRPNQADRLLDRITVEIPEHIAQRSLTLTSGATVECDEARSAIAGLESVGGRRRLADLLSRSEAVASSAIEAVDAEIDDVGRASIGVEVSDGARQAMAAVAALGGLTDSCDGGRPLTEEAVQQNWVWAATIRHEPLSTFPLRQGMSRP